MDFVIAAADESAWIRTALKSSPKRFSMWFRNAFGNGRPPPRLDFNADGRFAGIGVAADLSDFGLTAPGRDSRLW
jgi:hypothetical protein